MSSTLAFFILITSIISETTQRKPHIVMIVADDLGWNDVSWNNEKVLMPNLAPLTKYGVVLNQSYMQPVCTPSRVALFSGYYPFRVGRQNHLLLTLAPTGLSTNYTLLPERLRRLGYKTHAVGKWHLGYCNLSYTPTRRGFDSFFGYYNGAEDYYNHSISVEVPGLEVNETGYDFWNNTKPAWKHFGKYSTDVFTRAAINVVQDHPPDSPLFLYLAYQATHFPLEVPQHFEKMCPQIQNETRRKFCGLARSLDFSIGDVILSLRNRGFWNDTVFIFTSDNGGQVYFGGNNWPLRGNKHTIWEGGTRVPAFLYSSKYLSPGISNSLFHGVDWMPTIMSIAGERTELDLDGIDQWSSLTSGQPGPRQSFVYNIYDEPNERGAVRLGDYKLIVGDAGQPNGWIPPPELNLNLSGNMIEENGNASRLQLYNIIEDPEERIDLSMSLPLLTKKLLRHFRLEKSRMVPADDPSANPMGRPSLWGGTFSPGWCIAH